MRRRPTIVGTDFSTRDEGENCSLCGANEPSAVIPLPICAECALAVYEFLHGAMCQAATTGSAKYQPLRQPSDIEINGHVYYVRRGDLIKIGTTQHLRARMASLMPDEVLAVEPGGPLREAARHKQFAAIKVRGEWFLDHPDLRAHISGIRATHSQAASEGLALF